MVFQDPSEERAAARAVPLGCLNLDRDFRDTLLKLGIKKVGALLSLPAGGLRERFGPKAYRLYRAASGDLWEPLRPCPFEDPIEQKLLLDDAETDATRLLFFIKRLLHPMLAALAGRGEALLELRLCFLMDRKIRREERIRPAAPTLDPAQLLDLARLRLESAEFSSGVKEIELTARGSPAAPEELRLFAQKPRRDLDAANRALARLKAEFGEEAVARAKLVDRHLPEARFIWEPLERVKLPRNDLNNLNGLNDLNRPAAKVVVRRILQKPIPLPSQPWFDKLTTLRRLEGKTRDDGWLLLGPRYGAVERLSGPYVSSGGWWNREIHREYYFAETRRGDLLWIYYDKVRRRWFLQGWVE
ncbi:MAG: hypothetical protein HYV05_07885 [Deltaproteobacteria bacterium]|nr:hypothetical protein [Deltaproteobacteria bacterium]